MANLALRLAPLVLTVLEVTRVTVVLSVWLARWESLDSQAMTPLPAQTAPVAGRVPRVSKALKASMVPSAIWAHRAMLEPRAWTALLAPMENSGKPALAETRGKLASMASKVTMARQAFGETRVPSVLVVAMVLRVARVAREMLATQGALALPVLMATKARREVPATKDLSVALVAKVSVEAREMLVFSERLVSWEPVALRGPRVTLVKMVKSESRASPAFLAAWVPTARMATLAPLARTALLVCVG